MTSLLRVRQFPTSHQRQAAAAAAIGYVVYRVPAFTSIQLVLLGCRGAEMKYRLPVHHLSEQETHQEMR